jgi:hypothetical protein
MISHSVLLKIGNSSERNFREDKARILYSNYFSFKNSAASEKMWKNIIEPDETQVTIWHIQMATNSHSKYKIYSFSTAKLNARTRLRITL